MRSSIIYSTALLASVASAAPAGKRDFSPDNVYFPLEKGFPNPNQDQTLQIQLQAHGTLPNGPPPPSLSPEGIKNLQLIALNELFEVAYFTELVHNVTNKYQGYDLGRGHEYVLDALTAIVAQEELHLLNANGALKKFNTAPIEPCKYSFPVTDFQSAIALAGTFTDLVLGTLQDVNQIFAASGDAALVRGVSSVLGNEASQEGFFRLVQKKRPTSQAFPNDRDKGLCVHGYPVLYCPRLVSEISRRFPLKTFEGPLRMMRGLVLKARDLKVVFINSQNKPIVKGLDKWDVREEKVVFEAAFPYDEFLMNGLTIAAVTVGKDEFASADEVAEAAVFGPGLIEID
ncbi:hypothetical protein SNOG_01963 [Parastagonospora nodorum SN15]|uniref:Late sexual development protein n=1 Tax=Phaeosphaeria nodorum (strain SN15 / ATCC MYA-4574 / FGSC 10173) TaxID=321614 RepID=Q0V201_PHANO|nr:hypothetical protein SNOG_01963 [Parastagonospora nodorum SN15]EAT90175.2 hypothetical protein SNOG_01963 [Parastagonospora nodorum SN15]